MNEEKEKRKGEVLQRLNEKKGHEETRELSHLKLIVSSPSNEIVYS